MVIVPVVIVDIQPSVFENGVLAPFIISRLVCPDPRLLLRDLLDLFDLPERNLERQEESCIILQRWSL